MTIRARPEFTIPKAQKAAPAVAPSLLTMLRDGKTYRGIPLRAAAFSANATPKGLVNVVVVAESIGWASALSEASFALVNTKTRKSEIVWPVEPLSVLNGRATSGAQVPPGEYRLRAAVFDRDGHAGVVEYEFSAGVTQTAASLEIGDLMVGQGTPAGGFEPQLAIDDRAAVTGYIEMRGTPAAGTAISATFELAGSVEGPALVTIFGVIGRTASLDRWSARGAIPIGSYPPGDYVVRVTIKVNDQIAGRAVRALRKVGKS